jgi:O-succinylbenzoic acid--CoA ligase
MTVPDWLHQRAQSTPHRLGLICGDDRLTFAQLDAAVDATAGRLLLEGVQPGHVVGVLSRNSTAFVFAVHATARIGAVLMPLNLRLTTAELAWQLRDAGAHRLLHDEAHRETAVVLRGETSPLQLLSLDALTADVGARHASHLRDDASTFDLNATHSLVYTSGTTGTPKGAMLTYGNHLWSAIGSALNLGVHEDDRWLACLPLFHVGGLAILLRGALYGTTAIVHESFDAARANASIENDHVTIISVVANMLQRMLDERGPRPYPAHLRCVLLGGGPAPEPLLRRCVALGVPVVQTYGLTEAASQVATLAPEDALRKVGSAGKPLFGTELRIEDAAGKVLPARAEGEIVVHGPTVTPGYLNRPDATAKAIRDGWLHTGDIGYLDDEGYLYVLDRRDDLIVSGGENVYPAEIEATLQGHPDVAEAGVFGAPDERWGQTSVAIVVLRPGATVTPEALIAHCREHLAAYKTPRRIEFRSELPRNAAGKLVRSRLRSKGTGRDANGSS